MGAHLGGRTPTRTSKKGSEKVLERELRGRVLRRWLAMAFTVKRVLRRVRRRGSQKEFSRRCLERRLGEYGPLGVCHRVSAHLGLAFVTFKMIEIWQMCLSLQDEGQATVLEPSDHASGQGCSCGAPSAKDSAEPRGWLQDIEFAQERGEVLVAFSSHATPFPPNLSTPGDMTSLPMRLRFSDVSGKNRFWPQTFVISHILSVLPCDGKTQ